MFVLSANVSENAAYIADLSYIVLIMDVFSLQYREHIPRRTHIYMYIYISKLYVFRARYMKAYNIKNMYNTGCIVYTVQAVWCTGCIVYTVQAVWCTGCVV